jgi:hypothetical protein
VSCSRQLVHMHSGAFIVYTPPRAIGSRESFAAETQPWLQTSDRVFVACVCNHNLHTV